MENYVIKTEPDQGEIIKKGASVTLYVSAGDGIEFVPMPDVVGMNETEAKRVLTENGVVKVKVVTRKSERPDGEVLEQDVKAETRIPKDNTEVTIVVSEYDRTLDPNVPPADIPVSAVPDDENTENTDSADNGESNAETNDENIDDVSENGDAENGNDGEGSVGSEEAENVTPSEQPAEA